MTMYIVERGMLSCRLREMIGSENYLNNILLQTRAGSLSK